MKKTDILYHKDFPLSNKYDSKWILDNSMGPNVLWLTEWLCEKVELKPGMKVLDLGCGKAISSIFLAKEFNVKVWAYDLWIDPTENWNRVKEKGVEDKVFPIRGDARNMPFAEKFFDAIICIDSYIYFGTDDLYLNYLQKFVRPGGIIGIVVPGLMKEFEKDIPEHLKDFWGQDCWSWHTVDWWKKLWDRTGLVEIKVADTLSNGCNLYIKWKEAQDTIGKNPWPDDLIALRKDAGEYVGFIRLVANKVMI
ncbi:SAM-dependent methyltransferase [Thermosipho atlanticus]|uniref:Methyltransferase domain-containing protein n=1 Tax=Thermosipho atlanticus DSM 15807 TaxID=1123380 RepID=A0A1M5RAC9_9BACT|nr:methyltransferase domain-containing protein [Thermosipho atlanticus]SHH23294.1 Methyltransferase domain-containing protein [Thermosipho atlanticus DSM 15807]